MSPFINATTKHPLTILDHGVLHKIKRKKYIEGKRCRQKRTVTSFRIAHIGKKKDLPNQLSDHGSKTARATGRHVATPMRKIVSKKPSSSDIHYTVIILSTWGRSSSAGKASLSRSRLLMQSCKHDRATSGSHHANSNTKQLVLWPFPRFSEMVYVNPN